MSSLAGTTSNPDPRGGAVPIKDPGERLVEEILRDPSPSAARYQDLLRVMVNATEPLAEPHPNDRFANIRPYARRNLGPSRASEIRVAGSPCTYVAVHAPIQGGYRDFIAMVRAMGTAVIVGLVADGEIDAEWAGNDNARVWPYWRTRGVAALASGSAPSFRDPSPELAARARAWGGEAALLDWNNGSRPVPFLRYGAWPDGSVPGAPDVASVAALLAAVGPSPPGPIVVHCRAGVGRAGTFIAAHAMWVAAGRIARGAPASSSSERGPALAPPVRPCPKCGSRRERACAACGAPYDVVRVVAEMRAQRPFMVQRGEQVIFSVSAAREMDRMRAL